MRIFLKWVTTLTISLTSFLATTYFLGEPSYSSPDLPMPESFSSFYEAKLRESQEKNTRPGNEEKLQLMEKVKTEPELAFLYIHGFGASRAEGEEVMDHLGRVFKAPVYYLRLPGHGTNVEDHLRTPFQDYMRTAEESLQAVQLLAPRVILVGTSMGGMISTYLAGKYPDKVAGVVLASPFYDFADPSAVLYHFTWGSGFIDLVMGKIRKSKELDPKDESYQYWYPNQYYAALQNLMNLKRYFEKENYFEKIQDPVLMLYYYKSPSEQDRSASVEAMLQGFQKIQAGKNPHPLNRAVSIENGNHVLLSRLVHSDKKRVTEEIIQFVEEATGLSASKDSQKPKR